MDDSSSSTSSQNCSPTQTVIITPSQLEQMGLIVRVKASDEDEAEKKLESKPVDTKPPEDNKDLKIEMKNKLCTLLNHTPLVMQVKDVTWGSRQTDDVPSLGEDVSVEPTPDSDCEEKPKFKIVSDEKSNLSALEIENMLSSAKVIKSDDTISSPLHKSRPEDGRKDSKDSDEGEAKETQSTSKETAGKQNVLKKECLKRIQAKMYENLKKVLEEVDSFPLKDKACISVKPVADNASDVKLLLNKGQNAGKSNEKLKDKPCYMSSFRERKISQDSEQVQEDVIKIDDEPDDIVKIPKKRKRPLIESVGMYHLSDDVSDSVIEIADGPEESNKEHTPLKKAIVKQFYRKAKPQTSETANKVDSSETVNKVQLSETLNKVPSSETSNKLQVAKTLNKVSSEVLKKVPSSEATKKIQSEASNQMVKPKTTAKMINTSKVVTVAPRKRGRPRKDQQVETINIVVEQIDSDSDIESKNVDEDAKTPASSSDEPPRRRRGRPPKIAIQRKRGRPPKTYPNISAEQSTNHQEEKIVLNTETNIEEKKDLNTSTESQDNPPEEVKVYKKRGRKSKAEMEALKKAEPQKLEEEEEEEEKEKKEKYTLSRTSGRKRKVIDYHMLNGEDSDTDDLEFKALKTTTRYGRKAGRISNIYDTDSEEEEYESSNTPDNKRKKTESSEDNEEAKETPVVKRRGRPRKKPEETVITKEETAMSESEEDRIKESDNDEQTKEKEDKTEDNIEQIKELDDRLKQLDENPTSPHKEELEPEEVQEGKTKLKDDEVRCAICEEIVQEQSWSQHKRKSHNDLAWFVGEQPLVDQNLDDPALVEEKLNVILKEDGVLKCTACDEQTDSVEFFVTHRKKDCKLCLAKNETFNKTGIGKRGRKKTKPGGTADVMNFLFTNFTRNFREEPSESNVDSDCEDSPPQADQSELQKDQTRCAVCSKIVLKANWFNHKLSMHNNLAWRVGEPPLDLTDKTLVVKILHELYLKRKPLYCDVCGGTRKSVMGFLSHKSQCLKTNEEIANLKVTCHLCNRVMLRVSLSRHMVLSHSDNPTPVEKQHANSETEEDTGGKRKAANRASQLIRSIKQDDGDEAQFILKSVLFRSCDEALAKLTEDIRKHGQAPCVFEKCIYKANDTENLLQHMENCSEKLINRYTCNFCLATFYYRRTVKEHIATEHPDCAKDKLIIHDQLPNEDQFEENEEDSDDNIIYEEQSRGKFYKRKNQQMPCSVKFLGLNMRKSVNSCYRNVYKWTLQYHKENYTSENLFSNTLLDQNIWKQLDPSRIHEYLPKLKRSLDIATLKLDHVDIPSKLEHEWTNFKLFQSAIEADGTTTIFCGGPISSLAWVPIPYKQRNMDQILAVSVLPDPDEMYSGSKRCRDKGLIQFWNYGVLNNKERCTEKPQFEFGLVHDFGVVWCMEWCPSGCYETGEMLSFKRLGLLAIAGSDSHVYIYTIPQPRQYSGKIFQSTPNFKLILDSIELNLGETQYQATKLSWTKASGHSYLAVGYSNGIVGIFNLNTKSKLLRQELDGVAILKPTYAFRAHGDAVTALGLYHLEDGKRWLVSGSLDRESKLWDLRTITEPVTIVKKFLITDCEWLMHWLCPIYSFDHNTVYGSVSSALIPARTFKGPVSTFLPSNSRVTCISSSEWGNLFVQGNDSGEVMSSFPDQLLYGFDADKRRMVRRCRTLASYTAYVSKKSTPDERLRREEIKMDIRGNKKKRSETVGEDLSEPRSYKEACDSYGLVFCDMNKDDQQKDPSLELDKLIQSPAFHTISKPNVYPIQSITKIAVNPNRNSYLFYACGYHVGFLRTSSLRFLND